MYTMERNLTDSHGSVRPGVGLVFLDDEVEVVHGCLLLALQDEQQVTVPVRVQ